MPLPVYKFKVIHLVTLIAIVTSVSSLVLLYHNIQFRKQTTSISRNASLEGSQILQQLSQLIDLPVSETPTIATVTDKALLKSQPFFAKAENGDHIIVYIQAQKAILYRKSINKIIDIITINTSTISAQIKN